jgi:hypothetical protein
VGAHGTSSFASRWDSESLNSVSDPSLRTV